MQVAEVNSNVAQTLAPTFGDLAKSIGKVTNFGSRSADQFVQFASVKFLSHFLCKMTGRGVPPRRDLIKMKSHKNEKG